MPVNVTPNNALTLQLDGQAVECQVISLDFSPPGYTAGSLVEVACGPEFVQEPGGIQNGTLSGEVYTDLLDTGITWLLAQAWDTDAELTYTLVIHSDQPSTNSVQYTGTAKVSSFTMPFSKPGNSRHNIDLSISTATISRPA